jgi:hypothetical protein
VIVPKVPQRRSLAACFWFWETSRGVSSSCRLTSAAGVRRSALRRRAPRRYPKSEPKVPNLGGGKSAKQGFTLKPRGRASPRRRPASGRSHGGPGHIASR